MARHVESPDSPTMPMQEVVAQFWQWHIGDFSPRECWSPLVNVYRVERSYVVCADLAGLRLADVQVQLSPHQLTLQGDRPAPTPVPPPIPASMRIISMEIDHGPFRRTIALPERIDLDASSSTYRDGYLWIELPLLAP